MHLKRVLLSQFQSHKRTELVLSPNVNALVGNTDAGKSAIFRAISWALFNRCDDKGFRRRGSKSTAVDLIFEDAEISREKTDKENTYILCEGKKEVEYHAFKQEIPQDILTALNIDEINVQEQFDSPFLLSKDTSPGEVGKILNKCINLEIIDKAISNARKKTQSNARDIITVQNQIAELESQLEGFKYLLKLEKEVKAYEELLEEEKDGLTAIQSLQKLIDKITEAQDKIKELKTLLDLEFEVQRIIQKVKDWEDLEQDVNDLTNIVASALHDKVKIETAEEILSAEKELSIVLKSISEYKEQQKEIQQLQDIIAIIQRYQKISDNLESMIEEKEKEYKHLFPENMICPLCGK